MHPDQISRFQTQFDAIARRVPDENVEFWYARELMVELGYDRWENFSEAIERAVIACQNSEVPPENHFRGTTKMVAIGSGADRPVEDMMLTRCACYLVAQNGDPRKEPVAFAQTYFALQTRKQEIIEERMQLQERMQARERLRESETVLSQNIYERGVDEQGFGRIRSKGDSALFGGRATHKTAR